MFFPFPRGAMIGTERRLPVVRPTWSSKTGFTAGTSILDTRRPAIPFLPLAASWLLIERSSLNWAGLTGCFTPAYCEDLDICLRAWRRGWRCIYEADSHVWHRHQATWLNHSNGSLNSLELRNSALDAMVNFPHAQGSLGETAKSCKGIPRLAFLRRPSLDKDLSCNIPLLVGRTPALPLDESGAIVSSVKFCLYIEIEC